MLKRLFAILGLFTGTTAIDTVGTYGCTSSVCVFSNPYLRFGTGSENSVNAWGLFVQPWYFSPIANTWYKLTYSGYPLDTAIGMGTGSTHWSGTTIVDLYSLSASNPVTDYSSYYVSLSDTAKTVGYGLVVANRTFTVLGQQIILQNVFSLGATDHFVKIITRVINISPNTINNVLIWTGTRDDFVGTTDVNTKTRGNLNTGSFVAVTSNSQSSRAIMITNINEGVLFYSETPGVMTSYALCCAFSNAYNTNPLSLAPMTPTPTDGSYAAVLPIGTVTPGTSGAITWYYAAGVITALTEVAQSVAIAQAIDSGVQIVNTATPTATSSATAMATATSSPSSTATATETSEATSSSSSTATSTETSEATSSSSSTATSTGTSKTSATATSTGTSKTSATATATNTKTSTTTSIKTGSSTATATETSKATSISIESAIPTFTSILSDTSTASMTSSQTPSQTSSQTPSETPSQTPSHTPSNYPIKVLYVEGPAQPVINLTQIFMSTVNQLDNLVFLSVFVPVNILLLCIIGGGCLAFICHIKKKKSNTPVIRVRDELFTHVGPPDLVLRS